MNRLESLVYLYGAWPWPPGSARDTADESVLVLRAIWRSTTNALLTSLARQKETASDRLPRHASKFTSRPRGRGAYGETADLRLASVSRSSRRGQHRINGLVTGRGGAVGDVRTRKSASMAAATAHRHRQVTTPTPLPPRPHRRTEGWIFTGRRRRPAAVFITRDVAGRRPLPAWAVRVSAWRCWCGAGNHGDTRRSALARPSLGCLLPGLHRKRGRHRTCWRSHLQGGNDNGLIS